MLRLSLLLLALLSLAPCRYASAESLVDPSALRYITEEYYPYNYSKDGKLTGFSVELLRLMWAEMGVPEQEIRSVPWARAYNGALNIHNTVTFSMARTKGRKGLFKWVGPIHTVRFMLFAPRGAMPPVTSPDMLTGLQIGTVRDDVAENAVREQMPGAIIQSVSDMEQNLRKLWAGRLDLVAYEEDSMRRLLMKHGQSPDSLVPVYLLHETETAFVFHLTTPDVLVDRFQNALDAVRQSASYEALVGKYFP